MSRHAKHAMPAIPAGNIRITPISALALQMSHAIRVYFEREAIRRQLHAMSDRELADMGVARSGIDAAMDSWNGRS